MSDENVLDRLAELERKLAELERKVDHQYLHLASVIPRLTAPLAPRGAGELSQNVRRLIEDGDLIAAIKQYRAETGAGLKEAKDAIDQAAGGA